MASCGVPAARDNPRANARIVSSTISGRAANCWAASTSAGACTADPSRSDRTAASKGDHPEGQPAPTDKP
eukprot:2550048-Pyramimonas_sp.AAC.1